MWTRRMLKDEAKAFLRRHYWKAFLVCLIVLIVGGGNSSNSGSNNNQDQFEPPIFEQQIEDMDITIPDNMVFNNIFKGLRRNPLYIIGTSTFAFFSLLFVIVFITIGYALEVGSARFFLRGFEEDVSVRYLFSVFNREEYLGIVKTMFIRGLYNLLWYFLFIIPGIIKAYEYRMVPYILSKNPNLPTSEVIAMSRQMTNGHKWDMFVLDLSFIGWDLLAGLLFGLGIFFLQPYKEATRAKLYNVLSGDDFGNFDENIIYE